MRGEGGGNSLADEGAAEEVDAVELREHPRHHVRRGPQRRRRIAPDLLLLLPLPWRRHGRSARPAAPALVDKWAAEASIDSLPPLLLVAPRAEELEAAIRFLLGLVTPRSPNSIRRR